MARRTKRRTLHDFAFMAERIVAMERNAGFSQSELVEILPRLGAEVLCLKKNEVIVHQGESARRIGMVVEGNLQASICGNDGERIVMRAVRPGEFVGLSLLSQKNSVYPCDVMAFPSCTVFAYDAEAVREWRNEPKSEPFFRMLEEQLGRSLVVAWQKAAIVSQSTIAGRVMVYLSIRRAEEGTTDIRLPGTVDDFADFLACNRSALSRVMSQLKAEGRIRVSHGVVSMLK